MLDSRGNKKGYHRFARSQKLFRENTGALTYGEDNLATDNAEKAEVLNAFFALVFRGNCTQTSMCTSMIWERKRQETMMESSTVKDYSREAELIQIHRGKWNSLKRPGKELAYAIMNLSGSAVDLPATQ